MCQPQTSLISDATRIASLIHALAVYKATYTNPNALAEIAAEPTQIWRPCQVVSMNGDNKVQVLCGADFTNGDGPPSIAVIFKRGGRLDVFDMPVGEGNGDRGPVGLSIEDIKHDGRLELVLQERHVAMDGTVFANTDPAPTTTRIYVWRNGALVEDDAQFRTYFTDHLLPELRQQLLQAITADLPPRAHAVKISALQNSIPLVNRMLITGHY